MTDRLVRMSKGELRSLHVACVKVQGPSSSRRRWRRWRPESLQRKKRGRKEGRKGASNCLASTVPNRQETSGISPFSPCNTPLPLITRSIPASSKKKKKQTQNAPVYIYTVLPQWFPLSPVYNYTMVPRRSVNASIRNQATPRSTWGGVPLDESLISRAPPDIVNYFLPASAARNLSPLPYLISSPTPADAAESTGSQGRGLVAAAALRPPG